MRIFIHLNRSEGYHIHLAHKKKVSRRNCQREGQEQIHYQYWTAWVQAINFDKERVVCRHLNIVWALVCSTCFARLYYLWLPDSNENINGLIRQYVSKGSSFGASIHLPLWKRGIEGDLSN
jgi:IS30 family transposase